MGSWEVHSVVCLVSAGGDTLRGVLGLAGGGAGRGAVLGCFGYEWGDSGWVSSIFRPVTPATGSGFGCGGILMLVVVGTYAWWQCCVFRCWIGNEHILLGSTLTPGARSPLTVICDSKFPYWCMLVPGVGGGGLPKQQPKTKPTGMLCICCTR
jgi:hypothetical protein